MATSKDRIGKFLVLSDMSSHITKRQAFQRHSCDLADEHSAKSWADFIKATDLSGRHHKRKQVFIVQIVAIIEPDN